MKQYEVVGIYTKQGAFICSEKTRLEIQKTKTIGGRK